MTPEPKTDAENNMSILLTSLQKGEYNKTEDRPAARSITTDFPKNDSELRQMIFAVTADPLRVRSPMTTAELDFLEKKLAKKFSPEQARRWRNEHRREEAKAAELARRNAELAAETAHPKRNGTFIAEIEDDIVVALYQITPPPPKVSVWARLKSWVKGLFRRSA